MTPSCLRAAVAGAVLLPMLAGCARSGPARYYTLTPLASPAPAASPGPVLRIRRVSVPVHLRQAALVVRESPTRLRYAEFDLWAQPVEDGLPEVLADNLARLTGAQVVADPLSRPSPTPAWEVHVGVRSFEMAADGTAHFAAAWELRAPGGGVAASGTSEAREPVQDGIGGLPQALSRAVLRLSEELAAAWAAAAPAP
ncbi:MAG: membrane integrity-associated transporter subunit PqiC [Lentisphaeria bacterium]|nr:membrane integrity-associated transporter subunit PqiC [Lentisphaeria bacterium]